jgi:hypothetical protein
MGAEKNAELARYFRGRHIWDVFPDENPIELLPHRASDGTVLLENDQTHAQALPQSAMK